MQTPADLEGAPSVGKLEHRRVYRLLSRRFTHGVWDAESRTFIGLREKLSYLQFEREPACSPADGPQEKKALPLEALDVWLPPGIPLRELLESWCSKCKRPVQLTTVTHTQAANWLHADGSPKCKTGSAVSVNNGALFAFMVALGIRETRRP